jgi:hypothetical protein
VPRLAVARPAGADPHSSGDAYQAERVSPLVFDVVVAGETARLSIAWRNTGSAVWDAASGVAAWRVDETDVALPTYLPLTAPVPPGGEAKWDLEIRTNSAQVAILKFELHRGDTPFGPEARALAIVVPEELRAVEGELRALIEEQVVQWQDQTEQEMDQLIQAVTSRVAEWAQGELERQTGQVFGQLCGGSALLPFSVLAMVWFRRRR